MKKWWVWVLVAAAAVVALFVLRRRRPPPLPVGLAPLIRTSMTENSPPGPLAQLLATLPRQQHKGLPSATLAPFVKTMGPPGTIG